MPEATHLPAAGQATERRLTDVPGPKPGGSGALTALHLLRCSMSRYERPIATQCPGEAQATCCSGPTLCGAVSGAGVGADEGVSCDEPAAPPAIRKKTAPPTAIARI